MEEKTISERESLELATPIHRNPPPSALHNTSGNRWAQKATSRHPATFPHSPKDDRWAGGNSG